MNHPTTKQHYEKYHQLTTQLGIKFPNALLFKLTNQKLQEKYQQDKNLNNIPLKMLDSYASLLQARFLNKLSLAEGVCLIKHCLIYQVLNAQPEWKETYES